MRFTKKMELFQPTMCFPTPVLILLRLAADNSNSSSYVFRASLQQDIYSHFILINVQWVWIFIVWTQLCRKYSLYINLSSGLARLVKNLIRETETEYKIRERASDLPLSDSPSSSSSSISVWNSRALDLMLL